jgi:Ca2+/Na+ antiporter
MFFPHFPQLNVVMMFGNLFNIPYEILGLTAISWCNSIGDLIADVSVARQGMPRMGFSAAIGAPLFSKFLKIIFKGFWENHLILAYLEPYIFDNNVFFYF